MRSVWPSPKLISAAIRGIREAFVSEGQNLVAGVRSSSPWIFFTTPGPNGAPGVMVCERCAKAMLAPPAPTSRGLNGKGEPMFDVTTKDYALFLSTHLNKFYKAHEGCVPKEAAPAA